ncbi:hypothetical protein HPB51_023741 [Rhipicephalus microplus]|uniref:Uncharacterized protein n=1 Tax=Rhipicephalus microplus TaxID=6941 RepID=A0A9J6EIY8_RHIMP|nr:hypothetical protein HPB51_023741 [Rhipicephalus microplus]
MEPPEFQYLVSFQGRKKIISARGPTEADILEALKTTDFGHSLQACRIEVYNVRHDEFVDPPAGHVFSEKDKIRLVCSENFLMSCSYPGSLYEAAAKSLVLEYPVLRDTIGTGWIVDLSQHVASQHDEATINSHIDYMVKEIKRPIPDMQKLGDSMEQTRPSRQKWMKEMRPSTADVVLKYPALAKAEMLHEEFIALTGVNLEKKVLEFINRYGDRCFELAKCRRCAKEAVKAIEEEVEALDGDEKKYRFAVGIVELLPMLLKEQPRFLQGPDTYPALSLKGKNASEATNIVASFEGLSVEVLDVIAGVKPCSFAFATYKPPLVTMTITLTTMKNKRLRDMSAIKGTTQARSTLDAPQGFFLYAPGGFFEKPKCPTRSAAGHEVRLLQWGRRWAASFFLIESGEAALQVAAPKDK